MSADALLGTVLSDRYRVDALLGEGAMGRVYRAEHVLMRKRVALKILHRELTAVPEVVQRFEREAMASAHIAHPHVAGATDFGKLSDGSVFLVLEYVEGRALTALIEAGPVPAERTLRIGLQIVSALEAAHARGIVHRDLKPDNVLLVEKEQTGDFVKVLDFGIAKVPPQEGSSEGKPITQVGMVYGTPEYMAPEQALGQEVDARADLYALGVVLYEMLCGQRPYGGAAVGLLGQQLTRPLPLLSERGPGVRVPGPIEAFVRDLLVTDVDKRVPSAEVARRRIEELLVGLETGTLARAGSRLSIDRSAVERAKSRIPAPLQRVVSSRRSRAAMLALAFGIVGVGAGIFLTVTFARNRAAAGPNELTIPEPAAADAPKPDLTPEIEKAKALGVPGLEALAEKYPTEAIIHAELALALATHKSYPEAVDRARVALTLDPELNESPVIAGALFRAAQSTSASAAAFRLLTGVMGSAGADIIFDLYEMPTVRPQVKKEASDFLFSDDGKQAASPGLLVVLELSRVKECSAAESLLKRVAIAGDKRALPWLERLKKETGCGTNRAGDCWDCLRGKPDLDLALETISRRAALDAPE